MSRGTISVLKVIAMIEGVIIVVLMLYHRHVSVNTVLEAATVRDPFYWALEYEAPDSTFEGLVKRYPQWVSYRDPMTGWSVLPECAALGRTNVARILVANGADVEAAINEEKKIHNDRAVAFFRQIVREKNRKR